MRSETTTAAPSPSTRPPGGLKSDRLPLESSSHRPRSDRAALLLVGALVFVSLLFLGVDDYFNHVYYPPGSNCNDWYVYCPLGPGETPLGTALNVGNGSGDCPAG